MQKLVLIIGASGSGKTEVSKELKKEGYNIIDSYTTRDPREEGEEGHIFLNDNHCYAVEDYEGSKKKITVRHGEGLTDKYIALAFMESYGDIYFMTREQYKDKGTSIYVVDPGGADMVYENVKDISVVAIYLMCDRNTRLYRMLNRGDTVKDIDYRLNKDVGVFSKCKCDFVVDANRPLDKVVADVRHIIKNGVI